ncbi:DUF2791 family P-loop domain-containing protein [Microbispora sp. NEAU-D428]|uniref:ATP-binding protein n=1 Tax=Microbispora sitophila TaxID=2771537 RepID=UPI001866ADE0|nr:BREX system ATP-binding domain-containing protein [Microbispora sitophila]MBE3012090.1 DUF2791 family P-loop domain-containing protein [Microbispora sitophila]
MRVHITLLGRFAVQVDDSVLPADVWSRRQAAGLVKLLALAPRHRLHREEVIDALWPDVPPDQAAPRLHKAAHYARRALGHADGVVLRSESVSLFPGVPVVVDAVRFAEAATAALADGGAAAAVAAAKAYSGPLLPGDPYERWAQGHRDRLRLLYTRLLRQAEQWAELAELEPADEEAHLALIRRYAEQGDRRAALRQYERLDRALGRELGVAPGPEAVALREALLADPAGRAGSTGPAVLVGRDAQTRRLEEAMAEVGRGRGRTMFLAGAPGVGKSFLAQWAAGRAADGGWRTGVGAASTVEGAWPYAPVLEAVADLCRRHPSLLDGLDDRCRESIELALSGRDLDWRGDGGHQRLYVAVMELMRLASAGDGALLVVDDVHEADEASLRLLHYLARGCASERVLLLLCHRRQPLTDTFEQVRSSLLARGAAVELPVEPLGREETDALVRASRPDLGPETSRRIWDISGGLPFAVVEAARMADDGNAPGAVPGAVVLGLLDPRGRAALERVAIAGSAFDTDEFIALSGTTEDEAFDCLDAALAALVVERTASGYRFRHPLIREALLDGIPPHRQRRLHRLCAERLAALTASPARIGHHLLAAGDAEAAVPYVLRAAQTEAAVGAFREALALVDSIRHVAGEADRPRALALRADLLAAVGDAAAAAAYREAIEAAPPHQRTLPRARLAQMLVLAGDLDTAGAMLEELDLDGGPADSTILLARGQLAYFRGDLEQARKVSERARSLVTGGELDRQVLDLVTLRGLVAHNRGEWYQQLRTELRRTRDEPSLATAIFDSHLCVAEYLLYGPTPYREVIELAAALRETATRAGAMRAVAFATALIGEAALLSDDLDLAERELRESADLHREIGALVGESHSLQRLAELRLARGDRASASRLLNRALPLARWSNLAMHLMQRIYGTMIIAADGPREARAIVDRAWAALGADDICFFCHVMLAVPSAIACADVGDLDDARFHLAAAERSAELWEGTSWQAAILEARAHLARAEGDSQGQARLLARAADLFADAGHPRDAARCRTPLVAPPDTTDAD